MNYKQELEEFKKLPLSEQIKETELMIEKFARGEFK